MQSTFKITAAEFNTDFFEKIQAIIALFYNAEITITIISSKKKHKQSRESYFEQLNRAMDNIENNRNLISFTMQEFQKFTEKQL